MAGRGRKTWVTRFAAGLSVLVPVAVVPALGAPSASATLVYEISGSISVPNAGDLAVDDATNTIYVDNRDHDAVDVINGVTNTVTTSIPVLGPGPIAVNPVTDTVYVASLGDAIVERGSLYGVAPSRRHRADDRRLNEHRDREPLADQREFCC